MTDTKTSQLTQLAATPDVADLLMVVDVSDTTMAATGTNKRVAASYLARSDAGAKLITGNGLELTVPATGTAAILSTGQWTPDLRFGGATTGITYASRGGYYVKLGSWCFFQGWIALSSKGSATGSATMYGLPFTAANIANMYPPITMQWLSMTSNLVLVQGTQYTNAAYFEIGGTAAATTSLIGLQDTAFANNSQLRFSGFYQTA